MYKNRSQGFTLIELLVVIAIIGILSAVVLASLNTARSKGNNASIQSNLSTIQTQAEIYYGGAGANTYGPAFTAANCPLPAAVGTTMFHAGGDLTINRAIVSAELANGAANVTCVSTASPAAYAVLSQLSVNIGSAPYWCVDSTGFAGARTSATFVGAACPAS